MKKLFTNLVNSLLFLPCYVVAVLSGKIWCSQAPAHTVVFPLVFEASGMIAERTRWLEDFGYWQTCHLYNVICLRRRLIIVVMLTTGAVTVICCLLLPPIYSATCKISLESDGRDISTLGHH